MRVIWGEAQEDKGEKRKGKKEKKREQAVHV